MSDHIEGDTEILSSNYIFDKKDSFSVTENKRDLLHPLLWARDLQKQIQGMKN